MLLPIVAGGPGDQFATGGSNTGSQRSHPLGSAMMFADGRRFRYGRAGGSALATGVLCQQTLNNANWDELVVPAIEAIGEKVVVLTNGSVAITADYFADGFLNPEDDAGKGYLYTIRSNAAAAATGAISLTLYETLQVAWSTSTTVGIFANPYSVILIHPAPATAMIVGVTQSIIGITNYGWLQTWGPTSVLVEGTHIMNEKVIDSASANGAAAPTASTAAGEENYVGVVMEVAATTEYGIVYLTIS